MDVGGLYVTLIGMILLEKRPVGSSELSTSLLILPTLERKSVTLSER